MLLFVACSTPMQKDVKPNLPLVNTKRVCDDACDRLRTLGCIGESVQTGLVCNADWECNFGDECVNRRCAGSCESFCVAGALINPVCILTTNSCEEAESCHVSK